MKIGVLLSGCGVYDGAEIQEAVLTLLAIEEIGAEAVCISVNKNQYHVVNHLTGEVMGETRNMLVESARIARGNVKDITSISPADIDALVIPGGFGSAKNFTTWALSGAEGTIDDQVKLLLVNLVNVGKPIVALCVSPIVVAKAMEGSSIHPTMTIGTTKDASPYDISAFVGGLNATGAETTLKTITEIEVDLNNRIITAPCYMMETSVLAVRNNIRQALEEVKNLLQ